ncbi:hypothetical protein Adeg_0013 [Ammonifex degensii KC4]|uniref:Uncharacterized protein n=1 Tax=Ammonifex degensii (strain DSM 10501 / KC4) TaxID=429009 RepID=C9RA81_AMMDK|nr:hypothetical protein Adeg_0013 [Ammonifex degensii KC4]
MRRWFVKYGWLVPPAIAAAATGIALYQLFLR